MAALASIGIGLQGLSTAAGLVGTAFSVVNTLAEARAQRNAANRQAQELELQARVSRARGDRMQQRRRREARLLRSRAQAVGAAQGGGGYFGVQDFTTIDAGIAQEGSYAGRSDAYTAYMDARSAQVSANEARVSGRLAMRNGRVGAFSTALGGVGSAFRSGARFYERYQDYYNTAPGYG